MERKAECKLRNAIHRVTCIDYWQACLGKYTASIFLLVYHMSYTTRLFSRSRYTKYSSDDRVAQTQTQTRTQTHRLTTSQKITPPRETGPDILYGRPNNPHMPMSTLYPNVPGRVRLLVGLIGPRPIASCGGLGSAENSVPRARIGRFLGELTDSTSTSINERRETRMRRIQLNI